MSPESGFHEQDGIVAHPRISTPWSTFSFLWVSRFFLFSALLYAGVILFCFFAYLNLYNSDFAWGDVAYMNQVFFNAVNGRWLQTSIIHYWSAGVSFNPFPYLHQFAIHVNILPYLLAPVYALWPSVNCLYASIILINLVSVWWFTPRLLSGAGSTTDNSLKAHTLFAIMLFGPYLRVITNKCLFLLFAGPLILAAYDSLQRKRRLLFFICGVLLCLIAEDAALFVCSLSLFAAIFHRGFRLTSFLTGTTAAAYLLFAALVLQPATKVNMVLNNQGSSDFFHRLWKIVTGQYSVFGRDLLLPLLFGMAALAIVSVFWGRAPHRQPWRFLSLVFVAPASHWIITAYNGGAHHLLPILLMIYIALAEHIAGYPTAPVRINVRRVAYGILISCLVLFSYGFRPFRLPTTEIVLNKRWIAPTETMIANRETAQVASRIPVGRSLTYWTNRNIEAFISNRSDAWRFPYYFDKADFLLMQRNATESFFAIRQCDFQSASDPKILGTWNDSQQTTVLPNPDISRIAEFLLQKVGTHEVFEDSPTYILLRRKESYPLPIPEFTWGLGFIPDMNALLKGYAVSLRPYIPGQP